LASRLSGAKITVVDALPKINLIGTIGAPGALLVEMF
jgi:hypothetical protein